MLDERDLQLLTEVQMGLPICPKPYQEIGVSVGMTETEVIERLSRLRQLGLIKRMGVIVKHRQLGYRANAMIVWNIPEELIKELGRLISQFSFVTLCYQRPKTPEWPFNLYCMIHGKDRTVVLEQLERLTLSLGLAKFDRQILFSRRCFKQRGAVYQTKRQAVSPALANG